MAKGKTQKYLKKRQQRSQSLKEENKNAEQSKRGK